MQVPPTTFEYGIPPFYTDNIPFVDSVVGLLLGKKLSDDSTLEL